MYHYVVLNSDPSILGVYDNIREADKLAKETSLSLDEQIQVQSWCGQIRKPFTQFYERGKVQC